MIRLENLALRRGPQLLIEEVSLAIHAGDKLGLTGANGCGKSSLLALILGELQPDQGDCRIAADWVVAHVAQETEASSSAAIDYVMDGDQELRQWQQRLTRAEREKDGLAIASCHEHLQQIDAYQANSRAARLLIGLSFSQQDLQRPLSDFSGGWRMRLNLARALMCRSDLLLLDVSMPQCGGAEVVAVDSGIVYVDKWGKMVYRLDAKTGNYTSWEGRDSATLQIGDIWEQPAGMPDRIEGMDAGSIREFPGRIDANRQAEL